MRKTIVLLFLFMLTVTPAIAGDLADVIESGVLKFGTYPAGFPFSFYDQNEELIGIDISLMDKIADRIGVRLDVYDLAYDSLTDALTVGQMDVIGGAFSSTAARGEEIDFTRIYYSAAGIFTGPKHMPVLGGLDAETLAGMKVGVQKGSGYEEWLKGEAAEGILPIKNVFSFTTIEDAVKAMDKGMVDLVLMSEDLYEFRYEASDIYRTWTYGSPADKYAFAIRKGSDLKAEINKYLKEILADGTAQSIADSFFNGDYEENNTLIQLPKKTPAPTATAEPTVFLLKPYAPTAVPTATPKAVSTPTIAGCTSYSMVYVADVTIPDGMQISAGSNFTKIWRIRNNGSCTWSADFTFEFVSGDRMGGASIKLPKTVYPNDTVDLSVDMTAPAYSGTYKGSWQLKTPQGYGIGTPIWVQIVVPGGYSYPTSVPNSYQDVQPAGNPEILWFYPNFYTQEAGKCVNVYWGVTGNSTAELFVDDISVYFGSEEQYQKQLCNEVSYFGPHTITLCAYSTGNDLCQSFTYVTDPAGTPFSP